MKTITSLLMFGFWISSQWAFAGQPFPEKRPKLNMPEAIEKAIKFAEKKYDLKNHYMDRVWLAIPNGDTQRKWIVSWSPDGVDNMSPRGWIILTVDMEGNVSKPLKGVHWIDKKVLDASRNK